MAKLKACLNYLYCCVINPSGQRKVYSKKYSSTMPCLKIPRKTIFGNNLTSMQYYLRNTKKGNMYNVFWKGSYFLVEERKCDKRKIGKNPT